MTLDHAINQLIVTADLASQQIELLQRVLNAPKPERRACTDANVQLRPA